MMVQREGGYEVTLTRDESLPVDGGRWRVVVTSGSLPTIRTFRTKREATRWIEGATAIRAERWG